MSFSPCPWNVISDINQFSVSDVIIGAAAILLANDTTLTPSALKSLMQTKSIGGAISDAGSGSPNLLLYIADGNGGGGSPTDPEDPVDPVDPGVPGGKVTDFAPTQYKLSYLNC